MSGLTQGLCFLPVFLVSWSSSNFIIPYIIALYRHDVRVIFPYISATAAKPPESCIFGLMAFITACAALATIYARYKFVETLLHETSLLNRGSLYIGLSSCLGMLIVATFQQSAVLVVHTIGAYLYFITGVVYIVLQTVIGFQMSPWRSSLCVCWIRLGIVVLALLAFVAVGVVFTFYHPSHQDALIHSIHVIAACEWTLAFSFVCFFLTFINEFKLFNLRVKTVYTVEY